MNIMLKKYCFLILSTLLMFSVYGSEEKPLDGHLLGEEPQQSTEKLAPATRVETGPFATNMVLPGVFKHSISFSGAGFYYPYHLGVAAYLRDNYKLDDVCFLGSSAGALAATLLGCDVDIAKTVMGAEVSQNSHNEWRYERINNYKESWIYRVNDYMRANGVYGHVFDAMKDANSKMSTPILGDNANVQATTKVTISLTNISSWCPLLVNERISSFGSKDDLVNYGFASAHIPWLLDGNFSDKSIKDANGNPKSYIDGGFTDGQPIFNGSTLTVSPYKWSWIWGGKYNPLQILHFYGNTSMERNYGLYLDGYRDAAEHADYWKDLTKK